jgi:hypothetical protein
LLSGKYATLGDYKITKNRNGFSLEIWALERVDPFEKIQGQKSRVTVPFKKIHQALTFNPQVLLVRAWG